MRLAIQSGGTPVGTWGDWGEMTLGTCRHGMFRPLALGELSPSRGTGVNLNVNVNSDPLTRPKLPAEVDWWDRSTGLAGASVSYRK